ncbi:exodeoxyribonuclease-3 [Saccharopolyspora erythraea NRRL 2338]|uniref:AP endonuclease, family 1:exodeoxyribonuclease III xth n=2 Tax=Saccharopolyspora erythraea TaxID=1836 RepID=A4FF43_SACEN|nr:exodeoxyribonuclease III [Saccharopolyspora erythraea]EQD82483.1 exodeoxyribonuclease III [Saccharopolyspora erythraea D]PFG96393.1 exodeoxyribonuclease-3 [Saccharopolyspora erythraea NRRL 2338]QRK92898.1 exodeoxyribonuclease III [Saccharopolyspora erythraea]CAM02668.1 AP endonuclease, family 1:exodeoxyribonuclease III xth [Saccharopolyspora erythraea NRRL 2338]
MRIATWNLNSVTARLPRLLEWLSAASPDVLCVQELKCSSDMFPVAEVSALGYEVAAYGTGRWNGVGVLSRVGLDEVRRGLPGEPGYLPEGAMFEVNEPRAIGVSCAGVRLWSVYVPNGRYVGHPHYDYKLRFLEALRDTVAAERDHGRAFAVLGDFNIAPADDDVWDISAFAESTHVTEPERSALADLRAAGLADVYPRALKYDVPFTYWDYRAGAFPKNMGMRIDLAYGDPRFTGAVSDSYVDREARKGKGASDHAPLVIDLDL